MRQILQVITFCQGVMAITTIAVICYYYLKMSIKERLIERNALMIGISYSGLIICTMITSYNMIFPVLHFWTITCLIAYITGDITLFRMLSHIAKNYFTVHRSKKQAGITDKQFKERKKQLRNE